MISIGKDTRKAAKKETETVGQKTRARKAQVQSQKKMTTEKAQRLKKAGVAK